jgi:acyl-CoA hydrolase
MEKELKRVSDSYSEFTKMIRYEDINGGNRLFGGRLMEWIDELAGIVALRHSRTTVTTAAVDNLQFKKGAYIGDIVVLTGKLTYVGNTSMEVRTDVYVEDKITGRREVINRAYFTLVCIDEEGVPKEVPYGLLTETESEKREWEGALKRREMRKIRRKEGF